VEHNGVLSASFAPQDGGSIINKQVCSGNIKQWSGMQLATQPLRHNEQKETHFACHDLNPDIWPCSICSNCRNAQIHRRTNAHADAQMLLHTSVDAALDCQEESRWEIQGQGQDLPVDMDI